MYIYTHAYTYCTSLCHPPPSWNNYANGGKRS